MAHFKLSHSRAFYVRAYLLQTHEMLFDAHNHAFRVFGGVPTVDVSGQAVQAVVEQFVQSDQAVETQALVQRQVAQLMR